MSNVLIVDDEENVRMAIRYLADFESYGIGRIFEASNGVEARMVMNNNKVDILFTDICMPESDGVFLMNWVHQRYPNMVIIVISGYQNFDYILQAMRNGAIDYLLKPIDPVKLKQVIQKAIDLLNNANPNGQIGDLETFDQIKAYLDKNYTMDISLENIARKFGFNTSYLSRRFKQKYGMGIIDYITKTRIQKAKEILAENDFSKENTDKMKELNQQWKAAGFCGKDREDQIWSEFRAVMDEYFAGLKELNEQKHQQWRQRMMENRRRKQDLIANQKRQVKRMQDELVGLLSQREYDDMVERIEDKKDFIAELEEQLSEMDQALNEE